MEIHKKKLKILFLSPEAAPFAKTGGLADVAGSLPAALKKLGRAAATIARAEGLDAHARAISIMASA